ncbi:hypothetical protein RG47T_2798 [Mucilaginibacter polytrichastri]|uniref:Uncharacterized protein n=1 Tax=Mucilaginibacter polytrichastri TaxID=1302689 RepID=A0A1Q6A004_9SPHI|nr:hypothetical protein RG47T_2798 [Mucilaginibacter polytrichastri]
MGFILPQPLEKRHKKSGINLVDTAAYYFNKKDAPQYI